jgi:O-antigen/teichoic acid export membrane protein
MLMAQTGRLFVTNMASVSETGIYTVGLQIGMMLEVLASSFNRAYVPWLYERLAGGDAATKRRIVKYTYVYFALILAIAAAVALVAPWFVGHFVGERFGGAYRYTAWIALGCAFSGMYYMVANYVFYANKTHVLAAVTLVTAVANVGLSYLLIRANGPVGAAQASAVASLASFLLTWALSARAHPMPWNLLRAGRAS